ncbi:hypothetical protein ABWK22_23490 [Gottfriedia acidiceleris]|uniref:hypothetical protein n=1 Tax=Gottfriedia acidiceleris TaxID=371036 RepID=UPI003391060D
MCFFLLHGIIINEKNKANLSNAADITEAEMVTSLLVTIISEKGAQPVLSTMNK